MAPKLRRDKSNNSMLPSDARAWLRGEECGFFQFKPDEELQALWLAHGDDSKMFWRRDMPCPITLDDLEAREDQWLSSGDDGADKYGFNSLFVYKYYSDDEKQTLWNERGENSLYRWQPGMRCPVQSRRSPKAKTRAGTGLGFRSKDDRRQYRRRLGGPSRNCRYIEGYGAQTLKTIF